MPDTLAALERVSKRKFIHLSTTGRVSGEAHTVELWFAYANGKVYLSHEGDATDWMKNVGKNPRVKFEIGGKEFSGEGKVHVEGPEFEDGKFALYEKYYGKASKAKVDDWFSLSKVVSIGSLSGG
jgi:hypothetical protein